MPSVASGSMRVTAASPVATVSPVAVVVCTQSYSRLAVAPLLPAASVLASAEMVTVEPVTARTSAAVAVGVPSSRTMAVKVSTARLFTESVTANCMVKFTRWPAGMSGQVMLGVSRVEVSMVEPGLAASSISNDASGGVGVAAGSGAVWVQR